MKKILAVALTSVMAAGTVMGMASCGDKDKIPDNIVADKYKITVACQTEMGEEEVLKVLKEAYEAKNSNVEVEVKTFSGEGFEQYMLGIAAQNDSSPNIIWTADTYHSQWDQYFTDLRPYYEASEETDYSLYYETMLDAAATNGYFKPTKNYKGEFRKNDLDTNSDGLEDYKNHSEYGLYYAPRDYNKPAILCNTHLFKELDDTYERLYKETNSVTEMPSDYVSASARLADIVKGVEWNDLTDLSVFVRTLGERISYIAANGTRREDKSWKNKGAFDFFLEWEPTYTTVMNAMGIDLLGDKGELQVGQYEEKFQELYNSMFPTDNADICSYMITPSLDFSTGNLLMVVCSRPVVLGYGKTFKGSYGETSLQTISIPVKDIAAGNSGYAISNIWNGKGMTVDGVYKSYNDLSWDFIKFIISEEGQEIAGETGLNIPVLKKLYSEETNGGKTPAWRKVESLGDMSHDAWVAGGELRQDTFNIFIPEKRMTFRNEVRAFFVKLQGTNYYDYADKTGEETISDLLSSVVQSYALCKPESCLIKK